MGVFLSAGVALAAVAVAVGVWLRARGRVKQADVRVESVVQELTDRMEQMLRDLDEALEQARAETRRSRAYADLATSIDIDDVLARTLEGAAALAGVDAAVVSVPLADGTRLVRALGLDENEAGRRAIAGPPDGRAARAVRVSYHYGEDEAPATNGFIYGGVAVAVAAGAEPGVVAMFTRSPSHQFAEQEVRALEELASRAGPAIANALRFRDARQQADLDALTRLYNRRVFHATLEREVSRARRYERALAVIVFDVDDFRDVNHRLGHLAADAVLAEVADRVRGAVRTADVACRVGGDEFAVILPESGEDDALKLSSRLQAAISSRPVPQAGHVEISAGVAELTLGDDARTIFERADQALYRAKAGGKGRVMLDGLR